MFSSIESLKTQVPGLASSMRAVGGLGVKGVRDVALTRTRLSRIELAKTVDSNDGAGSPISQGYYSGHS